MSQIDLTTRLRRIERDIDVEKRIRKQIKAQYLSTKAVDQRLAILKKTAKAIRKQLGDQ